MLARDARSGYIKFTHFGNIESFYLSFMPNSAQPYKKRKLPLGSVQTFEKLRKEYDIYIDKTSIIL